MHPSRGFMTKVAGFFGAEPEKPAPPRVEEVAPPPEPPAATTGTEPAVQAAPEEPKKKRGFWSRLFGIGKGDEEKPRDEKPPKKKGGQ
jgi:hypothetical protein